MVIPSFNVSVENITPLSDLPNINDELSGAEMRALFDKAGVDIKNYINNTLITAIQTGINAKRDIGSTQVTINAGETLAGASDASWHFTASSIIYVQPTDACLADYVKSGAKCSAASGNALTFTCDTAPDNNLTLNVFFVM